MKPIITIIIRSWNSLPYLKLCLESIQKYTDIPHEMIIVDNHSTDGTRSFLRNIRCKKILNKRNLGGVVSLRQAEKEVKTDFLISLDSDVIVSPNWAGDLLKNYFSYPNIKAIGPIKPGSKFIHPYTKINSRISWENLKKSFPNADPQFLLSQYIKPKSYESFAEDFKKINNYGNVILECPPEFLSGCCIMTEREFIKKIGGLADRRYKKYGTEDADLCWRIADAGFNIMRTGNVFIHHFEGGSRERNKLEVDRILKDNNKLFLKRWRRVFYKWLKSKINGGMGIEEIKQKYWFAKILLDL
ncbi:MAG: glycosyltransferase family 2 protein [Minisyncoccia bacterium]